MRHPQCFHVVNGLDVIKCSLLAKNLQPILETSMWARERRRTDVFGMDVIDTVITLFRANKKLCAISKCVYSLDFSHLTSTNEPQKHTGHKPYTCPTCNESFSEAASLQQHQRRHTQERRSSLWWSNKRISLTHFVRPLRV
jgi:hypothetical protein